MTSADFIKKWQGTDFEWLEGIISEMLEDFQSISDTVIEVDWDSLHCSDCPCWERSSTMEPQPYLASDMWGYCRLMPGHNVTGNDCFCYQGRLIMSGNRRQAG